MRLGQLARQLDTKAEKIVAFLAKEKDITMNAHPNAKVEDALIEEITNYFKPNVTEETPIETKEIEVVEKEEVEETVTEPDNETQEPEHIETIKPEIKALKIVGKIDMPDKSQIQVEVDGVVYDQATLDKKKKEELTLERERKAAEKEERLKEEKEKKRKAHEQRLIEQERLAMLETEKHHILTKEEERKKAIIIKNQQERERKLEKKRKRKQKEHYAAKFTPKTPAQKKKLAEPTAKKVEVEAVEEPKETNVIKRFIKWLNT